METVGDFMEDWIKKWKQELSWQERWDVNGWGRKPKPKMVISLDDIYKDGKLFGCDVIYNLIGEDEIQIPELKLDYYREEDGKHYILDYDFDWEHESFTLSYLKFENGIPYKARNEINFHMLFSVQPGVEQVVFKHAAESIIREVEKLIDDDKKNNRNS